MLIRASGTSSAAFEGKFNLLLPRGQSRLPMIHWPTRYGLYSEDARKYSVAFFKPETDLETTIVTHPDFLIGITYGKPRPFHPEGNVKNHVRRALDRIDEKRDLGSNRSDFRIIGLIHDVFKYHINSRNTPYGRYIHAQLAERFAAFLGCPERILRVILLHDFCFYIEEDLKKSDDLELARTRAQALLTRVDMELYYPFTYIDRLAGDGTMEILDRFWSRARTWGLT
jgi:hypothetical protein